MIIITGASRNIGKYLFEKYSEKENVIGTFFNTKPGPKTNVDKLFQVDVSDYESVSNFLKK